MNDCNSHSDPDPVLEVKRIGELAGSTFQIAYYQRGYRWKRAQVQQLLEDIDAFQPTHKAPFYFLQALVLVEKPDGTYIVDGQQRLTTIGLIQKRLGISNFFSLEFQRNPEQGSTGSLDSYYRKDADKTIKCWLEGRSEAVKNAFAEKLRNASFLVYRIKAEEELAVFGRLNSGKIAAKDSELVKYIMLTPLQDEPLGITQSRAQEWDEIERALGDDAFFSFFVKRNTWGEEDRMAMLFCFAGLCKELDKAKSNNEVFPFLKCVQDHLGGKSESWQKPKSRQEIWKAIYGAYYSLAAWFDDPAMYHAVGWHLHRNGAPALTTLHPAEFQPDVMKALESTASFVAAASQEDERNKLEDVYNENPEPTKDGLLLYNVAFCWRRWPQKYDFQKHREIEGWSLEHIVARNEKKLSKEEFLKFAPGLLKEENWLEYEPECAKGTQDKYLSKILKGSYPAEDDHSLQNLGLLSKSANSSLNNSLFERKRMQVRDWADQQHGYWVPPATQAVFFKTIPGTDMAVHFWSSEDKQQYVKSIRETTTAFVNEVKKALDHE